MLSLRWHSFVALALTALLLAACIPDRNDYASFQRPGSDFMPDGAKKAAASGDDAPWPYGEFLSFTVTHPDSIVDADLVLAMRYDSATPLVSISLEISYPDDGSMKVDTVTFALCDTTSGALTLPRLSPLRQAEATVARIRHSIADPPVRVRHVMRLDTLHGVSDVGVFLLNSSPSPL